MTRPKLPKSKHKVRVDTTLDPDLAKMARASGNASEWLNEAARNRALLIELAKKIECTPKNLLAKIEAMQRELAELQSTLRNEETRTWNSKP